MRVVATITLVCVALAGCSTQLSGYESVSGGATTTTISSAISGSTGAGGGRVSFSSGAAPAPSASGGQVSLGRGGSAALIVGVVIVDAVQQFAAWLGAPKQPQNSSALPASIAETCSCYGYKPAAGDR